MTEFDYVVLVILVPSCVIGILRGLVKEILSLISWVVAFVVANAYGAQLAPMLSMIPGETVRLMVAFVALFLGVRIVMGLVMMAVDLMVKATGLSPVNRLLGAVFGLARGMLIVLAAVILCGMTDLPKQAFWTGAVSSPMAEQGARMIKTLLPPEFARHVQF
ncbi:CvpA family protein [Massilia genomosp. 1]|uniref:CvpA family protein n=1 Tax=Massilia genomosp. 1 TaxID=2609280 RepID=A0ABX0N0S4_9BURK|nr:CvpA family protein [Massilia genomosp. 1]